MQKRMEDALIKSVDFHKKAKFQDLLHHNLQSVLSSPIFIILRDLLIIENIALLIYEYLSISYCIEHKSHFPNVMESCFACTKSQTLQYDTIIYKFHMPITQTKRKREVNVNDQFLQLIFHEDDQAFKIHLLETISADAHINLRLDKKNPKNWYFVIIGNCWQRFLEIRDCKQRVWRLGEYSKKILIAKD